MNKLSLALTALSLSVSAPALASDHEGNNIRTGGDLSITTGFSRFTKGETAVDDNKPLSIGVSGALAFAVNHNISVQLDLKSESYLHDSSLKDDDDTLNNTLAAVHLSYRNPEKYLLGVFGGAGITLDRDDDDTSKSFTFAGVEGQYYLDRITLSSQLGWLNGNDDYDESISNGLFAHGGAAYYLTDNTKFALGGSYLRGTRLNGVSSGEPKISILGWNAGVEHRFSETPFSVTLGYNGYKFRPEQESDTPTVHEVRLGGKFSFGGSTLKDQDRYVTPVGLAPVERWISIATNEIE